MARLRRRQASPGLRPAAWASRVSAVGVLPPSTLALEDRLDHLAPFVTVQLPEVQPPGVGQLRRSGNNGWYNRQALRLEAVRTSVADAWAAAPALPPHWSIDRVEGAMAAMGRHLLATHCPPGAAAPRKP